MTAVSVAEAWSMEGVDSESDAEPGLDSTAEGALLSFGGILVCRELSSQRLVDFRCES